MIDSITPDTVRFAVALAGIALLGYWTLERLLGEPDDPTLSWTSRSETGYLGVLFSGTKAVALVAISVAIALWDQVAALDPLVVVPLLGVVFVHWVVEKEERE